MERRATGRYKVILPALCWGRGRGDFYAVTDNVSSEGIRFRSATAPSVDEELTCNIRHIGNLEGRVIQSADRTFVIRVVAKKHVIDDVARELLLLSEQQVPLVTRVHPRITPDATEVEVALFDGRILPGKLLNVSASGAAFTVDAPLEIGTPIVIGRTPARIARRFETGLGAIFMTPFDPSVIDARIRL
ncbi:PilZ domain-containing protein [Methylobacterium sp. BTF04]|nr:PilZ domain-containing protein [Methylobacterium sp. BTF04]